MRKFRLDKDGKKTIHATDSYKTYRKKRNKIARKSRMINCKTN